jgi:hypothetical protein
MLLLLLLVGWLVAWLVGWLNRIEIMLYFRHNKQNTTRKVGGYSMVGFDDVQDSRFSVGWSLAQNGSAKFRHTPSFILLISLSNQNNFTPKEKK